jgi:hypothetical protein
MRNLRDRYWQLAYKETLALVLRLFRYWQLVSVGCLCTFVFFSRISLWSHVHTFNLGQWSWSLLTIGMHMVVNTRGANGQIATVILGFGFEYG